MIVFILNAGDENRNITPGAYNSFRMRFDFVQHIDIDTVSKYNDNKDLYFLYDGVLFNIDEFLNLLSILPYTHFYITGIGSTLC